MAMDARKGHNKSGQMNFAPVKPLQDLKNNPEKAYKTSSFAQFVRELHNEISNRHVQERREIAEMGRLMANLRSGKLIMKRDPIYGSLALLKPLPHKPRSDRHVYPLAQVNSSQLTSIWTLSRPKAVPRHFGNTNRAQIQHALLQKVVQHYNTELFDELFHQQQSLSMMDYGTSVIRVYYDDKLNAVKKLQPIIENKNKTVFEGYGACAQCGYEGKAKTFSKEQGMPQCPKCKSFNIPDLVPEEMMNVAEIVGVNEISQGDIGAEQLPIPACNWDMKYLAHESSYFQYRSEVPIKLVESILGIEVAQEDPTNDYGLWVIDAIATRGGSMKDYGRDNLYGNESDKSNVTLMDEEWYEPEWYAGVKFREDEKTVSGETIPKDTPLEEIFPDGLCVVGFNDMGVLAGVYNEKRRIIGGVYHLQSFSGVGKGTQDSVEVAEHLNIAHSAALEQIKRWGAGGGYWYDADVMTKTEAQNLLRPRGLVGLRMKGTNYNSVENAIGQLRHNEMNQSNLAMIAQLANILNISFQTTEFTQGVANNVNVDTATGQQMLLAQNQQRSAAPLRMKGYQFARVAEHIVELFREHIKIPKFFGANDKFGMTKGQFVGGEDMPERVKFDFVTDSELPTNTLVKRQNAEQMMEKSQFFGVPFAQLVQMHPRLASWWADQFQAEIPLFNHHEMLIVCQERLDNLKQIVAQAEQIAQMSEYYPPAEEIIPQLLAGLARPLTLSEENLAIKAEMLSEYLDDDEVKEWSPLMRAAVEALIQEHYKLDRDGRFRLMALQQEGEIGLQMQAMMAQQAAMAPMQEAQAQAQGGMAAAEQEGAMLEKMGDMVMAEEDYMREQEAADNDMRRQMALKQMDRQSGGQPQPGNQPNNRG